MESMSLRINSPTELISHNKESILRNQSSRVLKVSVVEPEPEPGETERNRNLSKSRNRNWNRNYLRFQNRNKMVSQKFSQTHSIKLCIWYPTF